MKHNTLLISLVEPLLEEELSSQFSRQLSQFAEEELSVRSKLIIDFISLNEYTHPRT